MNGKAQPLLRRLGGKMTTDQCRRGLDNPGVKANLLPSWKDETVTFCASGPDYTLLQSGRVTAAAPRFGQGAAVEHGSAAGRLC